ncbi:hypothetical protein ACQE98_11320 [Ornithinimicrobium sp. W1679]|uniref:hypothetical protein n=1 Tax=Ornithinimicrobium sp. W1679 TaxID=3418770 RepID=UPI003CF730E4
MDPAVGRAQAAVDRATEMTVEEFDPPGPAVEGVGDLGGGTVHYVPASSEVGTFLAVRDGMAQALGHAGVTVETCDGTATRW